MREKYAMYLHVYAKMQKNHSCTSKMRKHHILANSVMAPYFFIYANRNKAEPREVTKQVVWIILRNRIFHGTIRHIRSGFPLYARTLCALTLPAYTLKEQICEPIIICFMFFTGNSPESWVKFECTKEISLSPQVACYWSF